MLKIIKYLKDHKLAVALIIALLLVQAASDLALPQYMSSIVDVGIQQGGIENVAPTSIRAETMESLYQLMTDEEHALVEANYALDGDMYIRQSNDADSVAALNDAFAMPMVMAMQIEQLRQNPEALAEFMQQSGALQGGAAMGRDTILAMRAKAEESFDGFDTAVIGQQALVFTRQEYEAQGVDMAKLQIDYLWATAAKMLGITVVMVAAAILVGLLSARVAAGIGMSLRNKVFSRVLSFSGGDVDKFSTASLITRSTNDIQQVQMVAVMLLRMVIYAPILGIGGVIKVMNTRTNTSWIIVVAVIAIVVLVLLLMLIAMPKFRKVPTLIDRINLVAREILTGLSVIRAFGREDYEEERFDGANVNLMKTQLFTNRAMTLMMPLMMLIMNCITLAIVWFGSKGVDMGTLQVGNLMAFISYTMQIVSSFLMLTVISIMLPRALVSANRVDEVLTTEPSILDGSNPAAAAKTDWRGEVTFDNVSFAYPDAGENVLEGISFTAKPGQTTAIIGSTGSGKSTLLNLIPRFFDVSGGRITMDGVDIRDMTQHQLRAQLGYVPQKGILFSGDIASNIKYGGDDITDEEMVKAAQIAQADTFIEEKDGGYESPIAQGGTNVSGGQKQRLSIARAIAKQPKVLLFDDSFSALDYRTDVTLRRALREEVRDATVVIVAQRISTILHADQILVMDEGRIVGKGTHEELMATNEPYQEIAYSQLSEAELKGGMQA